MYITHRADKDSVLFTLKYAHQFLKMDGVPELLEVECQVASDQIGTQGITAFAKSLFRFLNKMRPENVWINDHHVVFDEGEFVTACNGAI